MKKIEQALRELKSTVTLMALFSSIIDSFVVFLASFLLCIILLIPWFYSFIPLFLYGIIHIYSELKTARFLYIEKKLPFLYEQLRTVADNIRKEHEVIEALNEEVLIKLRAVKNSVFLRFGKITNRITTLVILSFLIIILSAMNIQLFDVPKALKNVQKQIEQPEPEEQYQQLITGGEDIIFGNKSVAELGYQELEIKLNPIQSEIDIDKIKEPEKLSFESKYRPKEIIATTDISYEENIPKDYQNIVRDYFSGITTAR
ncbi:hypothetical protein HYV79_01530 [Candidatus Woesearchaeota archaeon]|nr:hypothetical protein [Candidatus Woesearchaeota archaeon]